MSAARTIEVFSAGSAICGKIVELVREATDSSCEVKVLDIRDCKVLKQARELGIQVVPAIVMNGRLQEYCFSRQQCLEILKTNGICRDDGSRVDVGPSWLPHRRLDDPEEHCNDGRRHVNKIENRC